ncbi:uncharacterized protein FIBRA_05698 [Fibroporia radiculosa]|uniref:Uncharacterized protein n=1 Tax=Fibroporia radiculosa TaxID=599839 RepID=J4HXZ1_9APHY|nr:uncharacterized protein FIBRA_05698 [Fibroporia radiculosa]CCM03562.1 predicted protein [Fibroporia radiculosa]
MSSQASAPSHATLPIAISHPIVREASSGYFGWPSGSPSSCNASSPNPPGLSSPSSSIDSDCPLSPLETDSPSDRPVLTWSTAAYEAAAGIHYVLEPFPPVGSTVIGPPYRNEPLRVDADAQILVLEEVGEHALRVRVVETGEIGLLPAWDIEGALERLARLNMEFNEAATCPAERKNLERGRQTYMSGVSSSLAHSHDRCISFSERLTYQIHEDSEDDDHESVNVFEIKKSSALVTSKRKAKSVGFASTERGKVFRYPSEALIHAYYGEPDENEQPQERDAEWWWAGWESEDEIDD